MSEQLFNYSRPYGYHPEEVEKAIKAYNAIIKEKNNIIEAKDAQIEELTEANHRLMLEMSLLEVPSVSAIQENYVLEQFKKENQEKHPKRSENHSETPESITEKLNRQVQEQEIDNSGIEETIIVSTPEDVQEDTLSFEDKVLDDTKAILDENQQFKSSAKRVRKGKLSLIEQD